MDDTQRRVATGMALGMAIALVALAVALLVAPHDRTTVPDATLRLTLIASAALGPALMLFVCIARLAKHRFFTPADIHGSALTDGTDRARLLQALLQNTLEQSCLALPVYLATGLLAPPRALWLAPTAGLLFVIGRIAFFAGYARGAPARAFGFALTFYPTVLLLLAALVTAAYRALP